MAGVVAGSVRPAVPAGLRPELEAVMRSCWGAVMGGGDERVQSRGQGG